MLQAETFLCYFCTANHIYHRIEKTEKKMNSLCRSIAFICVLFITGLTGFHIHAENTPLPDSILTRKYISQISVTEPERALTLIDEMEQRKLQPQFRLDHMRSVVYQNGMSMYHLALKYAMKAYRNDSIRRHPDEALMLLELITDQYNGTGNYTESTRYALEGIELARQTGDRIAEANLLLYLGMNKRDMGLKDEADEYVEQALQMQEEMIEGCQRWKPVDDLIYIYGVKLTFAMYDGKYSEAIALLPRYEKLMEQFKNCPDIPEGMYDMRLACGYVTYARIFLADGQPEKGAEFYRKFEQTDYAHTDDGKQMRFDYLVGVKRYPEVLRFIHADKERWKEQGDTINYFYLERILNFEAQAYEGLGNQDAAAQTYKQMYILSDSLRLREKQNGVLELATIYETAEKEAQLTQQAAKLRENRMILLFAVCIIGLLGVLMWRIIRHARTIRIKNKSMSARIDDLLNYKDELYRRKDENLILTERLQTAEDELQKWKSAVNVLSTEKEVQSDTELPDTEQPDAEQPDADTSEDNPNNETIPNGQSLFDRAEREIISRKLFLQPDFSRADLMKLVRIPKNKFALLFKQYAGIGFSQYINNLRMDYAARMLKEHPDYAIDAIAKECGIPNKATFYRLFLEQFGMTPSEYRSGNKRTENE